LSEAQKGEILLEKKSGYKRLAKTEENQKQEDVFPHLPPSVPPRQAENSTSLTVFRKGVPR